MASRSASCGGSFTATRKASFLRSQTTPRHPSVVDPPSGASSTGVPGPSRFQGSGSVRLRLASVRMHRPPRPESSSMITRPIRLSPVRSASAGDSRPRVSRVFMASASDSSSTRRDKRWKWSSSAQAEPPDPEDQTRRRRSFSIPPSRAFTSRASQPAGTSTLAIVARRSILPTCSLRIPPVKQRRESTSPLVIRGGKDSK